MYQNEKNVETKNVETKNIEVRNIEAKNIKESVADEITVEKGVSAETNAGGNIDLAIQALEALKEEQGLRKRVEAQLEAQKGKVLFADALHAGNESILVRELATTLKQSGIEIGEERLFEWLRGNGYVYRQPCGRNLPTQKSLELGVMEQNVTVRIDAYGHTHWNRTAKITPKGRMYFFEKLIAQRDIINAKAAEKKAKRTH